MDVALVTGSSTGIGRATAIALARDGYEVYATMRDPAGGGDIEAGGGPEQIAIHVLQLDVDLDSSVNQAVDTVIGRSGRIDVLVNNAGIPVGGPIETTSDSDLKRVFETNFFGALRMIRSVLPAMRERGSGAIVNVTSQGGRVVAAGVGPYCASKFALEAASEALAIEVAPFEIRVLIIEPGFVLTPIFEKNSGPPPPEHYARGPRRFAMSAGALLQKPTLPDDVATAIVNALRMPNAPLRHTVGSEAESLIRHRTAMTDEEWIAIQNAATDDDYMQRMRPIWGEKLSGSERG